MIEYLIRGASIMSDLCIALFFFKFWIEKRDRLFLFFALAFSLLAASSFIVVIIGRTADYAPLAYLIRVLAYLLIIFAIVNKNRPEKGPN